MKRDSVAKIIILLLFLFYLFLLDGSPIIGVDQSNYILLGKSLSLGQGYRELWSVGNPLHTKFPFIFPLLLTPIIYLFGYNFLVMRLLVVIMAIGSLWVVYLLFKRLTDESTALIILILTGLSPQILYFSYDICTEVPYLFFSLFALIFIEKFRYEEKWLSKTTFFAISFILLAYFTRFIGISLVAAILIYLLFERKADQNLSISVKKVIFGGLSIFIPILFWVLRNYSVKRIGGFDYFEEFLLGPNPFNLDVSWGFLERMIHNVYAFVFYAFPRVLIGIQFPHRNFVAFILTGIIFYGFLYCFVKKRTVAEYYIIFYMFILFLWSWSALAGARFLLPLIPFVFYYFIVGVRKILETVRACESLKRSLFILLIGLLVLFNIRGSVLLAVDRETYRGYSKEKIKGFVEMAEWAKNNTVTNSIFGTIAPASISLHFERKAVFIPCTVDAGKVIKTIYKNKVDYIVVDSVFPRTGEYLKPIIIKKLDKFVEVYRKNDNAIYKVIK